MRSIKQEADVGQDSPIITFLARRRVIANIELLGEDPIGVREGAQLRRSCLGSVSKGPHIFFRAGILTMHACAALSAVFFKHMQNG